MIVTARCYLNLEHDVRLRCKSFCGGESCRHRGERAPLNGAADLVVLENLRLRPVIEATVAHTFELL